MKEVFQAATALHDYWESGQRDERVLLALLEALARATVRTQLELKGDMECP